MCDDRTGSGNTNTFKTAKTLCASHGSMFIARWMGWVRSGLAGQSLSAEEMAMVLRLGGAQGVAIGAPDLRNPTGEAPCRWAGDSAMWDAAFQRPYT